MPDGAVGTGAEEGSHVIIDHDAPGAREVFEASDGPGLDDIEHTEHHKPKQ